MGSLVGVLRMVRVVRVVNGHGGELCKNLNENTGLLVLWFGVILVWSCLIWSRLVCRDSQDELVFLYIGFDGMAYMRSHAGCKRGFCGYIWNIC